MAALVAPPAEPPLCVPRETLVVVVADAPGGLTVSAPLVDRLVGDPWKVWLAPVDAGEDEPQPATGSASSATAASLTATPASVVAAPLRTATLHALAYAACCLNAT
jgi:hypothetical protein